MRARLRLCRRRQDHIVVSIVVGVRRAIRQLEPLLGGRAGHHRSERADRLAEFDARVEHLARVRIARIGENRAVSERARTGFGRALEQRDDAVLCCHIRHQVGDGRAAARVGGSADASPCHVRRDRERGADLRIRRC